MDAMAELGRTMEGHAGTVYSVCVSADGSRLFSGSGDRTIKVWNVATGVCVQTLEGHTGSVRSMCLWDFFIEGLQQDRGDRFLDLHILTVQGTGSPG